MSEKTEQSETVENSSKEMMLQKIKELQKLPEEIVLEFLKSKGKLAQTDFARRMKV